MRLMPSAVATAVVAGLLAASGCAFADTVNLRVIETTDIHIHAPAGAIPKDGPSAGITLAFAIISVFTERPIRSDYAMTGEITLRGRVLGIGGIKEKLLAAHRTRRKNVILPEQNKKDLVDVPSNILRTLNIHFVKTMDEVIDAVLLPPPTDGRNRDLEHENSDQTDED